MRFSQIMLVVGTLHGLILVPAISQTTKPASVLESGFVVGTAKYEPIALAVHVTGKVRIHVRRNGGLILSVAALSGPEMLYKQAMKTVLGWEIVSGGNSDADVDLIFKIDDNADVCKPPKATTVAKTGPNEVTIVASGIGFCDPVSQRRK